MSKAHAILSPSGADRWLACPPSARFEEFIPEEDSEFSREGTLAHELAALYCLEQIQDLGPVGEEAHTLQIEELKADPMYNQEMEDHCQDYATHVLNSPEGATNWIEVRLNMDKFFPLCFGTSDRIGLLDNVLYVTDFKYGAGVPVSATNNTQAKIYALGAIEFILEQGYQMPDRVVVQIFQPRAGGLSEWSTTPEALYGWAQAQRETAELAISGQGEFTPGPHCRFCKAKTVCGAYFDLYQFVEGVRDQRRISDSDRAHVLENGPALVKWIESVKIQAIADLRAGKKLKGFKLVAGKGSRKFTSESDVIVELLGEGYGDEIFKHELKTLTDLEKLIGPKKFASLLDSLVYKTDPAPQLAESDDPRPAWGASAADDYD